MTMSYDIIWCTVYLYDIINSYDLVLVLFKIFEQESWWTQPKSIFPRISNADLVDEINHGVTSDCVLKKSYIGARVSK